MAQQSGFSSRHILARSLVLGVLEDDRKAHGVTSGDGNGRTIASANNKGFEAKP
jgi:hypothetical protein